MRYGRHTVGVCNRRTPGYVGFDRGGLLTDAVIGCGCCCWMDRKKRADVFSLLLQVMDNGYADR